MIHFKTAVACFLWLALLSGSALSMGPDEPPDVAMLYLHDGDFFAGRLADCDGADAICWHMRGATQPFDFPADVLRGAYFPAPADGPTAVGDFSVELSNGDLLYGSLASITPEHFEFDAERFGRLRIAREEVRRVLPRLAASAGEYRGPNGLAEWQASEEGKWRDEAGRLLTDEPQASVAKQLDIPTKTRIEFEIAGGGVLEFNFILSKGKSDAELRHGYRFEVWQRSVVIVRETDQRADVAAVMELDSKENRVQLVALIDQDRGAISVHSLDGKQLAAIEVPEEPGTISKSLEWITLTSGGKELRLERLAVGSWNGRLPPQVDGDKPAVCLTDNTVIHGEVVDYDPNAKQLVIRSGESDEERVDAASVLSIIATPATKPAENSFRVGLHDGSRICGELTKIAANKIYLTRRGVAEPLACDISEVRSLVNLRTPTRPAAQTPAGAGWLELDGVKSHGSLVAAAAALGQSGLVWQPRLSKSGRPLEANVSGRIVYREPRQAQRIIDQRTQQEQLRLIQIDRQRRAGVRVLGRTPAVSAQPHVRMSPQPNGAGTLYLLDGDRIPCERAEIDDAGVRFQSSVTDATFVSHSNVKALEFVSQWTATALSEAKRQRLLTLPRMQRNNPPTHLVASTTGDILRTRLLSMSSETLSFESRLENKTIPRDRIACLIWLHQEKELDEVAVSPETPPETKTSNDSPRVQAIRSDGVRLTFTPRECTGTELSGTSELLGDCHLELAKIDVLVLGAMIEKLTGEREFHDWKLTGATEPRYVSDPGGGDNPSPAIGSGLMGKPAPDIKLELLDGGQFQLSNERGHVVVLDFWASWCGPCMQSLPEVDAVVSEFADRGVKLVTVNMQEDRSAAASALERLNIKPHVALDVDGAAAGHYQVTAIPHTVVIDVEGNIAQLFVGSGPESAAQLRTAIEKLLTPTDSQ